jgi:hypothetical protein
MNLRRRKFLHLNAAAALALVFRASDAKSWPTRSVQLYVPAKTPPEIVNTDIVFMLRESAVKENLSSQGLLVASSRSEELTARNSTDAAMWKQLIEIKMD